MKKTVTSCELFEESLVQYRSHSKVSVAADWAHSWSEMMGGSSSTVSQPEPRQQQLLM